MIDHIRKYAVSYVEDPYNILLMSISFFVFAFEICQIYSVGILSFFYYIIFFLGCVTLVIKSVIARDLLVHIGYYVLLICLEVSVAVILIVGLPQVGDQVIRMHSYIVIFCSFMLVLIQFAQIIYYFIVHKEKRIQWSVNKKYAYLFIIACIISFVSNLECFNSWVRWDSYHYFNSTDKLSVENIFYGGSDGLVVCSHISSAFALFSMIVKAMSGMDMLNAMYLCNILLMAVDMLLFYLIIEKLLPERGYWFYLLSAFVCGFSPYVFGTINTLNVEHFLMTAVLLFICGNLFNQSIICFLAVFIMCNSKETGVVMAAAMMAVSFIKSFIGSCKEKKSINIFYYVDVFVVGILWLVKYKKINWAYAMQSISEQNNRFPLLDGTTFDTFSLSWLHITDIFKGEFLVNFNWIFIIIACLAMIKVFYHRSFLLNNIHKLWKYLEIVIGMIAFQCIMCSFVTYHLFRYYIVFSVCLYILGIVLLDYVVRDLKHRVKIANICLCGIVILFIVQCYYTIDPVMVKVFNSFDTGNNRLVAYDVHMTNFVDPAFMDTAVYNRQILNYDKAIDKSLSLINPDDDTVVLVSSEYTPKKGLNSIFTIWGFGYSYRDPARWIKFDVDKGYRYLEETSEHQLQLGFVSPETDIASNYFGQNKRLFYIEMPWESVTSHYLKEEYKDNFVLYNTVKYRGWVFNIYQFIDNEA